MEDSKLLTQLKETIESLRVYINNDGGDLSFVSFEDGILTLQISGACVNCSLINVTFDEGVKEIILTEYQGKVKDVQFIKQKPVV
jgi:Fe-S cluster biogenesis protein NfuA